MAHFIPYNRKHYKLLRILTLIAIFVGLIFISAVVVFFMPRKTTFSYAQTTCVRNPVFLPGLFTTSDSSSYTSTMSKSMQLFGVTLFSRNTCISMQQPNPAVSERIVIKPKGIRSMLPFISKSITVKAGSLPKLAAQLPTSRLVSTTTPLTFTLDAADQVFNYQLLANKTEVSCRKVASETKSTGLKISCDIAGLHLAHTTAYDFKLERLLHNHDAGIAFSEKLTTVQPVLVTGASIGKDQTIYDKPTEMTVRLNRPVTQATDVQLFNLAGANGKLESLPITTETKDDKITVKFTQLLPRSANLTLRVGQIEAEDGGYLPEPYNLPFKTSGGPKVTAVNIGANRVTPGTSIVLRFDSEVLPTQDLNAAVRIESGGKVLGATVTAKGTTLTVNPAQNLTACATFTVKVLDVLQNAYGVSGGNAWQFNSRMLCQTAFSIGTSRQGRSIVGYKFGAGPSYIVFVGGTHGNETSSVTNLQSWVTYLEDHPEIIPGNRTITIIPILNPDGYAANSRTNANNVDLNRNFPSNNWKQSVIMPDKAVNTNGGGTAPLSEPESQALVSYVQSVNPRLVLTYHAKGGVVMPNDSGDSNALAHTYDTNSNLYYAANNTTANLFEYDTTGAFEDWLHDKLNIPALLIEHVNMTGSEFNRNLPAMKLMIAI
jgi:hypothetical protein